MHRAIAANAAPLALLLTAAAGPASAQSDQASSGQVQRGEYIASAGGCAACHTDSGAAAYAGGLELETPFGGIYASNITPDPKTGIGDWTAEDFERSLREGVSADGDYVYPAMPYPHYTKMTDEDVAALWAYLRTQEPVENAVPAPDLAFPFNVRLGVGAWQQLYFEPGRFQPAPDKDAVWNRGAYLVEALGHCSACHSPRGPLGAEIEDQRFTGASIDGWYAPNIRNQPFTGVGQWSLDELETYLETGYDEARNVTTFGPMEKVVHDSLGRLTDEDVHAIALYLKDLPAAETPAEASADVAWPAERKAVAEGLYVENCQGCHQADGRGVEGVGPALAGNTALTAPAPDNLVMAMLQGFAPRGVWGAMPSFADVLTDRQIADVANYVRTAWGNRAEPNATPWQVAEARLGTGDTAAQPAVVCPNLDSATLGPALAAGDQALRDAAGDRGAISQLVQNYRGARPDSSAADTVQALSTAYCRVVVEADLPFGEQSQRIAAFAQQVAEVAVGASEGSSAN